MKKILVYGVISVIVAAVYLVTQDLDRRRKFEFATEMAGRFNINLLTGERNDSTIALKDVTDILEAIK